VLQYVNTVFGLAGLADVILFVADKHNWAWHDKIGGTCVIEGGDRLFLTNLETVNKFENGTEIYSADASG
jgi:hypothetical protein